MAVCLTWAVPGEHIYPHLAATLQEYQKSLFMRWHYARRRVTAAAACERSQRPRASQMPRAIFLFLVCGQVPPVFSSWSQKWLWV